MEPIQQIPFEAPQEPQFFSRVIETFQGWGKTTKFSLLLLVVVVLITPIIMTQKTQLFSLASPQTITVSSIESSTRNIPPDFYGLGGDFLSRNGWYPALGQTARSLNPQVIRYPGGEESNCWDWQSGDWKRSLNGFSCGKQWHLSHELYTLEDFRNVLNATGAIPDFVLNVLTLNTSNTISCGSRYWSSYWDNLYAQQKTFLQHAQSLGMPVKYIELGNELYFNNPENSCMFPSGTDYGRIAAVWINRLHKDFPGVKVAVVGTLDRSSSHLVEWNQEVLSQAPNADAMTLHPYPGPPYSGNTCYEYNQLNKYPNDLTEYPYYFTAPKYYEPVINKLPSSVKIWFTESNLLDESEGMSGSFAHGLFVGGLFLQYLDDPRVTMAQIYQLVDGSIFGQIFGTSHEFGRLQGCGVKISSKANSLTASGYIMKEVGLAMHGMITSKKLSFSPNPKVHVAKNSSNQNGLVGYEFENASKVTSAIILNLGSGKQTVKLDPSLIGKFNKFEIVSANADMRVTNVDRAHTPTVVQNLYFPVISIEIPSYAVVRFYDDPSLPLPTVSPTPKLTPTTTPTPKPQLTLTPQPTHTAGTILFGPVDELTRAVSAGNDSWKDYRITYFFTPTWSSASDQHTGVQVRMNGNNYIWIFVRPSGVQWAQNNTSGSFGEKTLSTLPITSGTTYAMQVDVYKSTIFVYINNKWQGMIDLGSLSNNYNSGGIKVYSYNTSGVVFKGITVTQLPIQ